MISAEELLERVWDEAADSGPSSASAGQDEGLFLILEGLLVVALPHDDVPQAAERADLADPIASLPVYVQGMAHVVCGLLVVALTMLENAQVVQRPRFAVAVASLPVQIKCPLGVSRCSPVPALQPNSLVSASRCSWSPS